ncbi:Hypothetical protein PHPALM_5235 [Phytophthora palmivora]|uniref:Uncharacterized protein n=1 Tax=Phytophthora palmivora TaxID=4796 RepID=A0A2P4YI24_9STRA|nr:Hypothetical protein PHPALM_5235 [Phytophthora palmivora]
MATSSYQLWLKKREFKAPRLPSSPAPTSTSSSSLTVSKESSRNTFKPPHESSESIHTKSHAVSAVETTQVAVKSVVRPFGVRKRPRSWLSSREEAVLDEEESSRCSKVAGKTNVAGCKTTVDKVAGSKRLRSGKEDLMKVVVLKLTHASKMLSQSSARTELERPLCRGRIDEETKVAVVENKAARVKSSSLQLMGNRKVEEGGTTGDNITKRLCFDDAKKSDRFVEERGLPPKSPMKKQRIMRTRMLDESQYWMAVDRFSHLT